LSSNPHQVEQLVDLPGVIAITNTGVTEILISKEQAEKTKTDGMKDTDFRVCVGVNSRTNKFDAVLVPDHNRNEYCLMLNWQSEDINKPINRSAWKIPWVV